MQTYTIRLWSQASGSNRLPRTYQVRARPNALARLDDLCASQGIGYRDDDCKQRSHQGDCSDYDSNDGTLTE